MEMTVELFNTIINSAQDCVFWKDKDRRFVGVNQAFLDFYGFESALIVRIRKAEKVSGYLICAVNRRLRIWQESECAVLYYVAGLLVA